MRTFRVTLKTEADRNVASNLLERFEKLADALSKAWLSNLDSMKLDDNKADCFFIRSDLRNLIDNGSTTIFENVADELEAVDKLAENMELLNEAPYLVEPITELHDYVESIRNSKDHVMSLLTLVD